jgi:hypothetical protein
MRIELVTRDDEGHAFNPPGFIINDDEWIRPAIKTHNGWAITINDEELHVRDNEGTTT